MTHRKKTRKRRTGLYVIIAVVLVMLGALSMKKYTLDAHCQKLEQQQTELEDEIASLQEERQRIDERAAYVQTPKYIEDIAREKLGLVYKDEIIFKADNK